MSKLWRGVAVAAVLGVIATDGSSQTVSSQSQNPRTPEELQADTTRGGGVNTASTYAPLPTVDRATSHDWPLNNLDLENSRYAPLDQINSSNIGSLAVRWVAQTGSGRATGRTRVEQQRGQRLAWGHLW